MTKDEEEQILKKNTQQWLDNKEYQAAFMLTPDIESEADYSHIDKNFAMTNLMHNKVVDEPSEMRAILNALHILNNPMHLHKEKRNILIGYEQKTKKPVYQEMELNVSDFPKTYHKLRSKAISYVNTSAVRQGFRVRNAIANRLIKEQTIEERTEAKSKWGFKKGESQ